MPVQHRNLTHSNLKTFRQHGFMPVAESGNKEVYGECIFCSGGRKPSMYVNVETKAWSCKRCDKHGGFQVFLKEAVTFAQEFNNGPEMKSLAKDRGLNLSTLKTAGVGYNPHTGAYIIPVPTMDGSKLHDVRIYKNKKMMATAGCKTGLFGWEELVKGYSNIWLCEGEWDALAMREALTSMKRKEETVLAVPGANTFKKEWAVFFADLNVNVLYDNDKAGKEGGVKVYNHIQLATKKLNFLHWRKTAKEGMDIRDIYIKLKKSPKAFFKRISLKLNEAPQDADVSSIKLTSTKNLFKFNGKGHTAEEVRAVYTKWLELKSTDVIDILYSTMIANRLPGDPIWLMLVAASGSTKSELIMSFDDVINVMPISTLTPHTLISGATFAGGGDPSLIPRLDQKITTIKDLTNLLNMNQTQREEIFGQLRDAYDGKASKPFGNGLFRVYESKFGVVAGVTPAIELYTDGQTALGERFLRYFIAPPKTLAEEKIIIQRAISNTTHEDVMRAELNKIAKETLLFDYKQTPNVPDRIINKIMCLAQWTAMLRGTINRDRYTKEATHKPFKELATRLAKQYYKLLLAAGMFRRLDVVTESEYDLLSHTATSTIPSRMRFIIKMMYMLIDKAWTIKDFEQKMSLPHNTCERIAEDLRMLKCIRKVNVKKVKAEWVLTKNIKQLMEESRLWLKKK